MDTFKLLHDKFNPRNDQIPPVRIKGFKRKNLYELFNELGFKSGAEIGVAEGINALTICKSILEVELYAIDLWDTYYRGTTKLKNREMQNEALALAHEKLDPYNVAFIHKPSMEAIKDFSKGCLDFVYIDGNHEFDYVMEDLIEWSRIVKSGGIISGHDAYRFRGAGVVDAVSCYTHAHQIHEFFLCDEHEVSFFWVNP